MERKSQINVLYMKRERSFFQVMFVAGKTRQDPQKNFYSFLHWFRYRYWIIVWKRRCSFIKIHFWYFCNMPNFFKKKSSSHWEICKAHSGYCILWHWCNRLYNQTFGSLSSLLGGNIQGTLSYKWWNFHHQWNIKTYSHQSLSWILGYLYTFWLSSSNQRSSHKVRYHPIIQ